MLRPFVNLSWVDQFFPLQVSLCQHFVIFISDDLLFSIEGPFLIQTQYIKPILTEDFWN